MKENTYFSIVMPVYNDEKNIGKAIESILNQTYKNWELIIVDDCSTDGTYEIAKDFARKNDKIKVFRNEKNRGAAFSMNYGTKQTKYSWLAIIDSDAIEPKRWLSTARDTISGGVDIFGGKVTYILKNKEDSHFQKTFYYFEKNLFPSGTERYDLENFIEPPIPGANLFYRKYVFDKIGGFDISLRAGYDRTFICLAVEKGFKVIYNPDIFIYHPLYNWNNISEFLKRTILFTKWKNLAFKKSKLLEKPYKKIPLLFYSFIIISIILILLIGIINYLTIGIIGVFIFFIYRFLILTKKMPIKYIMTYILLDFIKKSIAAIIYLLKLKPKKIDWKER